MSSAFSGVGAVPSLLLRSGTSLMNTASTAAGDPEILLLDAVLGDQHGTRRALRLRVAQDESHPLLDLNLTMPQLKVMILLSEHGATSGRDRLELTAPGAELIDRVIAAGEDYRQQLFERLDLGSLQTVAAAFDLLLDAVSPDAPCQ
jgi:hypothetical protein